MRIDYLFILIVILQALPRGTMKWTCEQSWSNDNDDNKAEATLGDC